MGHKLNISPKLKRFIIGAVSSLVILIAGLAVFLAVSNVSAVMVYDLRIIESETNSALMEKEVYLSSKKQNSFDIRLAYNTNGVTAFNVTSSNPSVARVTGSGKNFKVHYLAEGSTTIVAYNVEASNIRQSFELNVKENLPTTFSITDEKADNESEVSIFSDQLDYSFNFTTLSNSSNENVNVDCLSILDYNQEVFNKVEIDYINKCLIFNAKHSKYNLTEYITVQSKMVNDNQTVINNYIIKVNIQGYYVCDIQLCLSLSPNDDATKFIFGNGVINEGEIAINQVVFTDVINEVDARVRVVYTNGKMKDITTSVTPFTSGINIIKPIGGYCIISNGGTVTFQYIEDGVTVQETFEFKQYNTGSVSYQNFMKSLYVKDEEKGIYTFNYWDQRYERQDIIVNEDGQIVGFKNA